MSLIKSLMVTDKVAEIEFPDIDGFVVSIKYIGRDRMVKLRNQSLTIKFNKRTKQREEEVDNDKFLELYAEAIIVGWKGLTVRGLSELLPIDTTLMDKNTEVPYSPDEAFLLLKNSSTFDQFISDSLANFEISEAEAKEENVKN